MYQDFETDVMDDLAYDAAEGPARSYRRSAHTLDAYDDMDAYDEFDVDEADDDMDALDAMEEAMTDALEAEDSDEFLRRVARGIRGAVRVARQVGRGIGQVARVVAPIASAIPLPQAQAIARVARVAGRVLADSADEFEAIDAMVDLAEDEDVMDAAAPAIASMAIHGAMPQAAWLPAATRRNLVQAATQTTRRLAAQQGPQAVRALPAIVQTAQRVARQQGLSSRNLPQVLQRLGTRISRNPQLLRRMLGANPALRQRLCAVCARRQARGPARRSVPA